MVWFSMKPLKASCVLFSVAVIIRFIPMTKTNGRDGVSNNDTFLQWLPLCCNAGLLEMLLDVTEVTVDHALDMSWDGPGWI